MTTLVIAEHDNATLKGATLNTITAATQVGGDVHVLVAGHNAGAVAAAAAAVAGVSKVLHADSPALAEALAENLAAQVLAVASGYSHIFFPSTANGKNTAPRVAARLDVGQLSDISKVVSADTFERPISRSPPCVPPASTRRLRRAVPPPWKRSPPSPTAASRRSSARRSPSSTAPS
jgi:electron transfer flavoprotein alpha subunit